MKLTLLRAGIILVGFEVAWTIICILNCLEPIDKDSVMVTISGLRPFAISLRSDSLDVAKDLHIGAMIKNLQNESTVTVTVPKRHRPVTLTLTDGSHVTINHESEVVFPFNFSKDKREIILQGQAYLQVHKDASRPFIVRTKEMEVLVLGTTFEINAWPNAATTAATLYEGAVRVRTHGVERDLMPGNRIELTHSTKQIRLDTLNAFVLTPPLWLKGDYRFTSTYLEDVCKELERMYSISIWIDDSILYKRRISGTAIGDESPDHFLEDIKESYGIYHYTDASGRIHLTLRPQ